MRIRTALPLLTSLALVGILLTVAPARADQASVNVAKDQWVAQRSPNTTQPAGALRTRTTSNDRRWAFLGVTVTQIPADATGITARLRVYARQAVGASSSVYWANNTLSASPGGDWTETNLTWNNKPDPPPASSSLLATKATTSTAAGWVEYDVSGLINRNGSFTLLLRTEGRTEYLWDGDENPNVPNVVITWSRPGTPPPDFEDTFDGTGPDAGKWGRDYPWDESSPASCRPAELHELQCYEPEQVTVSGGTAKLTARQVDASTSPPQRDADHPYASGLIQTQPNSAQGRTGFASTMGYFEADIRVTGAQGAFPAFWLIPTDLGWPPEIDIMETTGEATRYFTNYHYDGGASCWCDGHIPGPDLTAGMHTYALRWDADSLEFLFDGRLVRTITSPAPPNEPMYIVANLAVGGAAGPPDPADYPASIELDAVRAWRDPNAK